jgi:hypothetical protein
LPALESLFRRVPAAAPAHAAAAELLAALLPPYVSSLSRGPAPAEGDAPPPGARAVASVLTTLKKFLTRCCSLPDPDVDLVGAVGVHACALLSRLLDAAAGGGAAGAGPLAAFAAAQLLPGTQVRLRRGARVGNTCCKETHFLRGACMHLI